MDTHATLIPDGSPERSCVRTLIFLRLLTVCSELHFQAKGQFSLNLLCDFLYPRVGLGGKGKVRL